MPLICFKCIYELILLHEGKASALRFFAVAKDELENISASNRRDQTKQKATDAMKQLGVMPHDLLNSTNEYAFEPRSSSVLDQSKPRNNNGYFTLYYKKKARREGQPEIVSISREGSASTSLDRDYFVTGSTDSLPSTEKKNRLWREDFAERL